MTIGPFLGIFLTIEEGDKIAEILSNHRGPITDVLLAAEFTGQWEAAKKLQEPSFIGYIQGPCDIHPITRWGF